MRARAVVPCFDLAGDGAQGGQAAQVDLEQDVDQPAQRAEGEGQDLEQARAQVPQEVLVGTRGGLDGEQAVVFVAEIEAGLHDGNFKRSQRREPVRPVRLQGRRLFAQAETLGRGVFRVQQIALGDRRSELRPHGGIVAHDGGIRDGLRQCGELAGSLHAQGGVGVVPHDLQDLLAHQDEQRQHDHQHGAHDAALRTESVQQGGTPETRVMRETDVHTA